jgi:hypothetical protein
MYIEISCVGEDGLSVVSVGGLLSFTVQPCDGQLTTITAPTNASDLPKFVGKPLTLTLTTAPSVHWAIYIVGTIGQGSG